MSKFFDFLQMVAAGITAAAVIGGGGSAVYLMLDEQFRVATQGWVADRFGEQNDYTTLTTANININYHEKKKCQGVILDESAHVILQQSYQFYEQVTGHSHRYTEMSEEDICIDRGVTP